MPRVAGRLLPGAGARRALDALAVGCLLAAVDHDYALLGSGKDWGELNVCIGAILMKL